MAGGYGQTKNYVWNTDDFLGRGATADVYKGREKKKGFKVAVKVFNIKAMRRSPEVQDREFDILQKLNHENVVRLIAVEPEMGKRSSCPVLVMEYCEGGSLHTFLEEPQNAHGLSEAEFITCMGHITSGMRHLREQSIVHRDVKPGNILRAISEDGRSVYKLTDFGGAKELPEGEQFMSLIGTEEYLHPALYQRALLHPSTPHQKEFAAEVDLWSMGVTLYHAATGDLPFRPYGGRNDRANMHHITTKKASGVISGVMKAASGPIEWSRELPETCSLSRHLRKQLPPLLAGLMECDISHMCTFDDFFCRVDDIVLRIPVSVFNVCTMEHLTIYLLPTDQLDKLYQVIEQYTDVVPSQQFLYYEGVMLASVIPDPETRAQKWPMTSQSTPIVLVGNTQKRLWKLLTPSYLRVPHMPVARRIGSDVDIYDQQDYATDVIILLHDTAKLIADHQLAIHLMHATIKMFCSEISHELEHVTCFQNTMDQIKADVELVKTNAMPVLVKIITPDRVKELNALMDKTLQGCEEHNRWTKNLSADLGQAWPGVTLITDLDKQRLVGKIKRFQSEGEEIFKDLRDQMQNRAYLTSSNRASNEFRRVRLDAMAKDAILALQQFMANEATRCLDGANVTFNAVIPTMSKLQTTGPVAACLGLVKNYIDITKQIRENLSTAYYDPSTLLRLSGSHNVEYLTGSQLSSQSGQQKSSVLPPSKEGEERTASPGLRMDQIVSDLKRLSAKNAELLDPMKENMDMVKKIKELVEKNYGVPEEIDGWTLCDTPEKSS